MLTKPTTEAVSPYPITAAHTVNAAMAHSSSALFVLHTYGIDTCCGGNVQLCDAAREAGVDPAALLAALDSAASLARDGSTAPVAKPHPCNCGCR